MRKAISIMVLLGSIAVAGCDDSTQPSDVTPPAAPRGVFSVTGDGQIEIDWLANTEGDLAGYRVYESPCLDGPNCPYDRIGVTAATRFLATGQTNGVTMYYAVSAVDRAGNESELSHENLNDTPRPAGSTTLGNFVTSTNGSAWDFSAAAKLAWDDPSADMIYGNNGNIAEMFCTQILVQTQPDTVYVWNDIQDAGFMSLDGVDVSPVGLDAGWSPTHGVELIPGHCYIVWTWDDHYAKFRVTGLNQNLVSIDWAYQTDQSNPQLLRHHVHARSSSRQPLAWIR